ncbi:MAG: hypothetical protein RIT81_44930 [Deltaproteobacteria bacterium]
MKAAAVAFTPYPQLRAAAIGDTPTDVQLAVLMVPNHPPVVFVRAESSSTRPAALGASWTKSPPAVAACLLSAALLSAQTVAAEDCPTGQYPTNTGCVVEGLEAVPILPIERAIERARERVSRMAEHTKNKRKSTSDKHSKPRSGRSNTKNRQQDGWRQNPNKRK